MLQFSFRQFIFITQFVQVFYFQHLFSLLIGDEGGQQAEGYAFAALAQPVFQLLQLFLQKVIEEVVDIFHARRQRRAEAGLLLSAFRCLAIEAVQEDLQVGQVGAALPFGQLAPYFFGQ